MRWLDDITDAMGMSLMHFDVMRLVSFLKVDEPTSISFTFLLKLPHLSYLHRIEES